MQVLIMCNSFGKGGAATAHLATELAEGMVVRGYKVEVWSRGETRKCWVPSCGQSISVIGNVEQRFRGIGGRHLSELMLFFLYYFRALKSVKRYDVVVCMDTPRFASLAAGVLKRRFGSINVAWVMDLAFEQVARRSGRFMGRVIPRLLMRHQVRMLRRSDCVITLGGCMASLLIDLGVPEEKIEVVGSWAESNWPDLKLDPVASREKFGMSDRFTVMYSGFAGDWHDFDSICEAVLELSNDQCIQWVFAGAGPGIEKLRRVVSAGNGGNIWFPERVERQELPSFLSCADVHLVSLRANMLGTCVPSKLYPLMALGKPVVFVGPSGCQAASDITAAEAGSVVGNGPELMSALLLLGGDPGKVEVMGAKAKEAFCNKHCAKIAMNRWCEILMNLNESSRFARAIG